ncbi:MAG: magnesium transporter MgtE N-terminal domain-containing protein [Acidimicrobiales bacterium]
MHLSALLGSPLLSPDGDAVGRVDDVIVRLRGGDYPVVTGLVANVGHRRVFVAVAQLAPLGEGRVALGAPKVDLRSFERREGEVLLREDILRHRLIDVTDIDLVRAWDLELAPTEEGWVLSRIDTRRPPRLLGRLRHQDEPQTKDWKAFEPLIGHAASITARSKFGRLGRLKPAQIADLLEEASRREGQEILGAVHSDPELEADVFEELHPDTANRLFGDRSDAEVADVIAHMRADDAADAVAELPQHRRQAVLDHLPPGTRTKVVTLLGFNAASAGGIMGVDLLCAPSEATVEEALRRVRLASSIQPEALVTVHAVDDDQRLMGTATIVGLLQADPEARLVDVVDADPVRVTADADVVDVTLLMADYNLMTVPVVDSANRLLGVITVDDVLEATIPEDRRRREPPPRPESPPQPDSLQPKSSPPPGSGSEADRQPTSSTS